MDEKDLEFEKTLDDSKMLLDDASRVADEDYEFTLESILEEFGANAQMPAVDTAPPKPAVSVAAPLPELPDEDDEPDEGEAEEADDIVPALDTPQSYSLQQVLERTVQEALD